MSSTLPPSASRRMIMTSLERKLASRVLQQSTTWRSGARAKKVVIGPSCWYASASSITSTVRSFRVTA
ncbi:MAG TPA: hypothetical protein VIJ47_11450 [Acidimicrobiales bacterium]